MNQEQKLDAMKQTEAVDYHSTRSKTTNVTHNVLIESLFRPNAILMIVLRKRCGFERGLARAQSKRYQFFRFSLVCWICFGVLFECLLRVWCIHRENRIDLL